MSQQSKAIRSKLRTYANTGTFSNLSIGVGIVGVGPLLLSVVGAAVVLLSAFALAAQKSAQQIPDQRRNYFIAIMVGLVLCVIGVILSLISLAEVIEYVKLLADDPDSMFEFRNPVEEAYAQADMDTGSDDTLIEGKRALLQSLEVVRNANLLPSDQYNDLKYKLSTDRYSSADRQTISKLYSEIDPLERSKLSKTKPIACKEPTSIDVMRTYTENTDLKALYEKMNQRKPSTVRSEQLKTELEAFIKTKAKDVRPCDDTLAMLNVMQDAAKEFINMKIESFDKMNPFNQFSG
jgi:hypothetical protein